MLNLYNYGNIKYKIMAKKLVKIILTMEEIWKHTIPKVEKNKKKYNRKTKHKNK